MEKFIIIGLIAAMGWISTGQNADLIPNDHREFAVKGNKSTLIPNKGREFRVKGNKSVLKPGRPHEYRINTQMTSE